jgi:hypothetical protein
MNAGGETRTPRHADYDSALIPSCLRAIRPFLDGKLDCFVSGLALFRTGIRKNSVVRLDYSATCVRRRIAGRTTSSTRAWLAASGGTAPARPSPIRGAPSRARISSAMYPRTSGSEVRTASMSSARPSMTAMMSPKSRLRPRPRRRHPLSVVQAERRGRRSTARWWPRRRTRPRGGVRPALPLRARGARRLRDWLTEPVGQ